MKLIGQIYEYLRPPNINLPAPLAVGRNKKKKEMWKKIRKKKQKRKGRSKRRGELNERWVNLSTE